ncbi:MAG: GDSL-type esterase/lipase family protein [Actinoallomurus sp.]
MTHAFVTTGRAVRWCLPALALTGAVAIGPSATATSGHHAPTAAVSLGDSFISGEAGRWQGNAVPLNLLGDRWGTDRGAYDCNTNGSWCYHDAARVYGSTTDGCDRSDSAEIANSGIAVDHRINLACSGATTANVIRAAHGGVAFKGEKPQADQLAEVARKNDVKLVVLSIGGNDLGFSDVIEDCVKGFLAYRHCHATEQPLIKTRLTQTAPKIEKAVDEIRAVMNAAGHPTGSYRFVLQSYPSPIPRGAENAYPETYAGRAGQGGCPVYNDDSTWARDTLVSEISLMLHQVASRRGLDFLDLRNLFQGREVCAKAARQAAGANSLKNPVAGDVAEWARFLVAMGSQGTKQESLHPNYYGQLALGACLRSVYGFTGAAKHHVCHNVPGKGPKTVTMTHHG